MATPRPATILAHLKPERLPKSWLRIGDRAMGSPAADYCTSFSVRIAQLPRFEAHASPNWLDGASSLLQRAL